MSSGDDQLAVMVAGTAAGQGVFKYESGGPDWHAPWDQLPKVEILAKPEDSLRSVLARGAQALGVSLTSNPSKTDAADDVLEGVSAAAEAVADRLFYASFRREDDDERGDGTEGFFRRNSRSRKHTVMVVRDSAGRALWRRPPFMATMAELTDAHEAGLLEGDPLRAYLILTIPQGSIGVLGEWQQFQQALEAAWHLRGLAAELVTFASFIGWVRNWAKRRSGKAVEAVRRHSQAWAQRGAAPADLYNLLAAKPRSSDETAALLGCSKDEAEAILWGLGFTPKSDGTWIDHGGPRDHFWRWLEGLASRLTHASKRHR